MDTQVSSFKLEYNISNRSNSELIVKTRGGLNYIIRKQSHMVSENYVNREVRVRVEGVTIDSIWIDHRLAKTRFDKRFLELLEERIKERRDGTRQLLDRFSSDFYIHIRLLDEMADENGVIHSDILGISLYNSQEAAELDPASTHGFVLQELFDMAEDYRTNNPKGGLHYFIYLNDPLSKLNPIYTNVMGKAVRVPVVADTKRPAGLYVGLHFGNQEPQELYYLIDDLNTEELRKNGLFETREECAMGGNTERALSAEKKLVEHSKAMGALQGERIKLEDSLEKSQAEIVKLAEELRQAITGHRTETDKLKHEHRMAMYMKDIVAAADKAQSSVKDTVNRANQDIEKKRNSVNNWGEIAKAAVAVTTGIVTIYKLYTS